MLRIVIAALLVGAPALADDAHAFHCDGKDAFLFEEMKAAGTVAYGETWDHTTCDQGVEVYAEGTTSRWQAFKPRFVRDGRRITAQQAYYANLVPIGGALALGVVGLGAGLMALASRRARRSRVVDAPCPGCATPLPIVLDDPASRGLFCPRCGTGSWAEVSGTTVTLRSS